MATNALAPKPKNAMAHFASNPMEALLQKAAEAPEYGILVDYLSARRMMPPIKFSGGMTGGEFARNSVFGNELPRTGEISVGRFAGPSTLVHELTHAADNQLNSQYYELKNKRGDLTPAERQFMQAYEKLSYKPPSFGGKPEELPRQKMAEKLDPAWAAKQRDYRSTNVELPAWGMGSTQQKDQQRDYSPPLHLDPTMASEFMMLLDLARKAQPIIPGR